MPGSSATAACLMRRGMCAAIRRLRARVFHRSCTISAPAPPKAIRRRPCSMRRNISSATRTSATAVSTPSFTMRCSASPGSAGSSRGTRTRRSSGWPCPVDCSTRPGTSRPTPMFASRSCPLLPITSGMAAPATAIRGRISMPPPISQPRPKSPHRRSIRWFTICCSERTKAAPFTRSSRRLRPQPQARSPNRPNRNRRSPKPLSRCLRGGQ